MREEDAETTIAASSRRRDLGDFQTPAELAAAILRRLWGQGTGYTRLLEPTCGRGVFLREALALGRPPREMVGVEIHPPHADEASRVGGDIPGHRVQVIRASLFHLDLKADVTWQGSGPLLVVGNPPWVTAAELGRLGSDNSPARRNVSQAPGMEAKTGASNFDLAEAVWIKVLEELAAERPTVAMLCKTAVARSVLEQARRRAIPVVDAAIFEINAPRWFGAAVGACLFRVSLGTAGADFVQSVPVFPDLESERPRASLGFRGGRIVADARALDDMAFGLGECSWTWRQGVKHDAADVMELTPSDGGGWRNGLGETVAVEPDCLYPLAKGADLKQATSTSRPRRALLVTQRALGEDTESIRDRWPLAWSYLQRHASRFEKRRSSIYRNRPRFAIFGIGPYSFAPWKVAIGGLLRKPAFRIVGPVDGCPTMLDDTCYLLPCESAAEAAVLAAMGNGPVAQAILAASTFPDAKRPVTKRLLQRLDLSAILLRADDAELASTAQGLLDDLRPIADVREESVSDVITRWKHQFRVRPPSAGGD